MRYLLAALISLALLLMPATASAHETRLDLTFEAQATFIGSCLYCGGFHYNNMSVGESQVVYPGETWYLDNGNLWAGANPPPADTNGGPRRWGFSVFVGWNWHAMDAWRDTGFATQRVFGAGNDTHDTNTMQGVEVGTRRYWYESREDGFTRFIGLKVVHDVGPWAVRVTRLG